MKIVSANITGSLIINGSDVTETLGSSSLWSGSLSTRTSNLELFSGSINAYTASNNTNISNINATTASLNSYTASNNTNIGNINATTASLNSFTGSAQSQLSALQVTSGSNITRISALEVASGSAITRLSSIESTTGSLNAASGSAITRLNALEVTSGSNITRISALEVASGSAQSQLTALQAQTGSYATTGSNIFVGNQTITGSIFGTGSLTINGCITATGQIVAQTINVQQVTSSIVYSCGSNVFGCSISNTQQFTGSLQVSGSTHHILGSVGVGTTNPSNARLELNIGAADTTLTAARINLNSGASSGETIPVSNPNLELRRGSEGSGTFLKFINQRSGYSGIGSLAGSNDAHDLRFHTGDGSEKIRITPAGVACFSDTVCANTFKSRNLIVCEGSSNATIASSNNEVLRIQGLCSLGMFTTFVSGSTIIGDVGNTSQIFSSGNATGFGANARGNRTLEFGTNQASRLSIAATGESTFACQVCAPTGIFSSTGYSNVIVDGTNSSGWGSNVAFKSQGTDFGYVGSLGSLVGSTTKDMTIWSTSGNGFRIYTNGNNKRLEIDCTGIACFSCQVCMPSTAVISGGGNTLVLRKGTGTPAIAFAGTSDEAAFLVEGMSGGGMKWYTSPAGCTLSNAAWNAKFNMDVNGISTFSCTVCALQYITTQGSSVSYAAGTNYIVWSSEGEFCSCDTNTGGTYTTMKTWIADRTGCLTLRFAGYIQSGPNYFAWRVVRNGSSSFVCGDYLQPLAPGCSTSVHAYTTFQANIGPVNPGDCITLQMVSANGSGVPVNGLGQFLFAKELRLHSTTPNFSAGTACNIFGDRLGVGTNTPCTAIDVRLPIVYGLAGETICSYPIATFIETDCAGGRRGLQIGVPAAAVNSPVYLKVMCTSARFSIIDASNCEDLTISGNKVGIGTTVPNEKLTVWTSSTTGLQTALRLNNPFGFSNLNTGTQIVFSQDRSTSEDLKQGIIAVGQADAGTSATSYMAFYTNNTGLGERLRITSAGIACFSSTVCAPRLMLIPTTITNSTSTVFAAERQNGIAFFCGLLDCAQKFGVNNGTYNHGFYFVQVDIPGTGRGFGIYAFNNSAANGGFTIVSTAGGLCFSNTFCGAAAISLAFDGSTRGPFIMNNIANNATIYTHVLGGV